MYFSLIDSDFFIGLQKQIMSNETYTVELIFHMYSHRTLFCEMTCTDLYK